MKIEQFDNFVKDIGKLKDFASAKEESDKAKDRMYEAKDKMHVIVQEYHVLRAQYFEAIAARQTEALKQLSAKQSSAAPQQPVQQLPKIEEGA